LNQRIFQNILQEHWPYTIKIYTFLLAAKEVPLCGGRDRRVVKYGILSIQGLMEKLQAREIQGDVGAQTLFSKMFLDIPRKEEEDLEEEIEAALTYQMVDRMKGTGRLVQLTVAIQDLDLTAGLTNQKLNAIIVKRQVIMLGIVRVQQRGLRIMQVL
jgi:hypothetical protein